MSIFKKKEQERLLPTHIAIIMDGNGRWAKKRSLPRTAGHVAGAKTFKTIARYCNKIGLKYLTVYAFSTENWKRPEDEVKSIMNLLRDYLNKLFLPYSLFPCGVDNKYDHLQSHIRETESV